MVARTIVLLLLFMSLLFLPGLIGAGLGAHWVLFGFYAWGILVFLGAAVLYAALVVGASSESGQRDRLPSLLPQSKKSKNKYDVN